MRFWESTMIEEGDEIKMLAEGGKWREEKDDGKG